MCRKNESYVVEVIIMKCNANKSIGCTVKQCMYHCGNENFCSLDKVNIGTHETNPTEVKCTDCESFRPCNGGNCN